ncbi:MAG: hypothetical protein IJK92_05780 [Bacteroidales bacterium]|nr:hypothetical protein [Bacteroidales bacterium]
MSTHFFIILLIIGVIVIIQLKVFSSTIRKINDYYSIFPSKPVYTLKKESLIKAVKKANDDELKKMLESGGFDIYNYLIVRLNNQGAEEFVLKRDIAIRDLVHSISKNVEGINPNHNNPTFQNIINSINTYMENNKSVNDYHLMKDIVDRNCDSKEDEINTQTPIPLYLGLVGTMAGILVGILFLWLSGGLADLLNSGNGSGNGANGIEALLGGVALAMISSILGIVLTTLASNSFKSAKTAFDRDKNLFYSWIQENLLPKLSDNVVDSIREMTHNLSEFNETFANNVKGLDYALSKVNESYKQQTEIMTAIQKIADKDLSVKNLQLFNALTNSAQEIENLGGYLKYSNEYLANVKALNENLSLQEKRTQIMEDVGVFFKTEADQIEERRGLMSRAVGTVDDYLKQALDKLKDNIDKEFAELQNTSLKNQDVIRQKAEEIEVIVRELNNLGDLKKNFSVFSNELHEQNSKITQLSNAIKDLAEVKKQLADKEKQTEEDKPKHIGRKILIGCISTLMAALIVANWSVIYDFITYCFRF